MPSIKIPHDTLHKAKAKVGIYKESKKKEIQKVDLVTLERAFRQYCRSYERWTQEREDLTWNGFIKVLKEYL